jgi:hypothetical protein
VTHLQAPLAQRSDLDALQPYYRQAQAGEDTPDLAVAPFRKRH